MRQRGRPEGLPEANEGKRLWAYGTDWTKPVDEDKMAKHIAECNAAKERHDVVVAQILATPCPPVPEAVMASQDVKEIAESEGKRVQLAKKKKSKGKKHKLEEIPESQYPGSTAFNMDDRVAACTFSDGRTMQGYITKGASEYVWFVTGRHALRGGEVVDGLSIPVPYEVTLRRPGHTDAIVTVVDQRSNGDDRAALRLTNVFSMTYPVRTRAPQLGGIVQAKYLKDGKWLHVSGQVQDVGNNHVAYTMSTEPGCCRMAIFDQQGYVVAGHYYPAVPTPKGVMPGGEKEPSVIPDKWVAKYTPLPLVTVCPQGSDNHCLGKQGPTQRVEKRKIYGLRQAKYGLYKPEFFMMKPSTEMLRSEIAKFWEGGHIDVDAVALQEAIMAVLMLEDGVSTIYERPSYQDFEAIVRLIDADTTNAGAEAIGETHHEYLTNLGDGSLENGIRRAAQEAYHMFQVISGEVSPDDDDKQMMYLMSVYCVQGKRDGYKLKKLDIGRSVQAPSFTLKVIWRAVFAENDQAWGRRNWMFRTGADPDQPVTDDMVDEWRATRASLGLDESAFDRRMPAMFMQAFFRAYLPYVCPGVPVGILEFFADTTINTKLLMTDGMMYWKDRGNPSGFPATLRLNCIVQLMAWCYAYILRMRELGEVVDGYDTYVFYCQGSEHMFLEICGDDSRANCKSPHACAVLDVENNFSAWLAIWEKYLPWEVKIEGAAVFTGSETLAQRFGMFPPLVSRNIVLMDGYVWTPLFNTDRCIRKLMSVEGNRQYGALGRSVKEDAVLQESAFMTLRLQTYWHVTQKIFSPTVQHLIDNGWLDERIWDLVRIHVADAYRTATFRRRVQGETCRGTR